MQETQEPRGQPLGLDDALQEETATPPPPDFLHEEGHGQRNLAGIVHGVAKSQRRAEHNAGAQQRSAFLYDGLRLDEAHLYFNLSSLFKDPITKYSHILGYF